VIYCSRMQTRFVGSLLVIALLGTSQSSFAYDVPVLNFGVSPRTLDEVKRLEEQFMRELFELESRFSTDVYGFIAAFDALIDKQLANVQCTAAGLPGVIYDQFRKSANLTVNPSKDLEADWKPLSTSIGFSEPPRVFANAYADFIYRSELTYCKALRDPAQGQNSPLAQQAKYYEGLALKRYRTWQRLQHSSCKNAADCYENAKRDLLSLLEAPAHQQDLDVAKLRFKDGKLQTARDGSFKIVDDPSLPNVVVRSGWWKFDSLDYQEHIANIIDMGDAVMAAFEDRKFPMCLSRLKVKKHISRGGQKFEKTTDVRDCDSVGIKTMPNGRTPGIAEFELKYEPQRFSAILTQHDECDSTMPGAWTEVLIDGKGTNFRLHQRNSQSHAVTVDIPKGAKVLTLMSTSIDDGQCTGATWFEARVQ
jgi:hypothetical protein